MDVALKQSMQEKLESLGLPFEQLKVFGSIRLNIHVVCFGRDTADKWACILSRVVGSGGSVSLNNYLVEAKHNKNTVMNPTKRKSFLIVARED
jgi:hypothetical protein